MGTICLHFVLNAELRVILAKRASTLPLYDFLASLNWSERNVLGYETEQVAFWRENANLYDGET